MAGFSWPSLQGKPQVQSSTAPTPTPGAVQQGLLSKTNPVPTAAPICSLEFKGEAEGGPASLLQEPLVSW